MKREANPGGRARRSSHRGLAGLTARAALLLAFALGGLSAQAQAPHASGASGATRAAISPSTLALRPAIREEGVRWQALTPAQREALAPLERDWSGIDAPRKQKWLALAARFKTLSPEEKARIGARMSEWAKLTPAERGQARMRFEEVRQVPATDRSARWQAYQALSTEQRQRLAARAASAASGSHEAPGRGARVGGDNKESKFNIVPNPALSRPPRQVAPTLVQAGPGATTTSITRKPMPPAHQQTGMPKIATTPEFVNRATLLPKRGPQAAFAVPASGAARVAPVIPPARPIAAPALPVAPPASPVAAPASPVAASAPR